MKLTCDLCGGALQINLGGQGATCTNCGLGYTMDRLKEKLSGNTVQTNPPAPVPPQPIGNVYVAKEREPVDVPAPAFDYEPQQFVMELSGRGNGDLSGRVKQGGIGLGDKVYLNADYNQPYTVYSINDDPYMICAKEGMPTELFIDIPTRQRKILKTVRMVTGDPNPVANAYNYPGTVREYFSHLLLGTFGEYEIRGDVAKDGLNIPVTYLFSRDGKPVLAVFLINSNDSKARYQVEKAARIFAPEGVACTHFFENYRNDAPYVINRIKDALPAAASFAPPVPRNKLRNEPVDRPQPDPIVLEIVSANKRPGMAWGNAKCFVRQGVVACGMPYYARINRLDGDKIPVGSLSSSDVAAGSNVKMLLYCDKALLPKIEVLYVFPDEEYDDGDQED